MWETKWHFNKVDRSYRYVVEPSYGFFLLACIENDRNTR